MKTTAPQPAAASSLPAPVPHTPAPVPTVIDATALPATQKARRTGRIARLPKTHRDMVNRMLANGVPYKNIVLALDEDGLTVTERNISSWATGGFREWQLHQDLALQNRLDQDHLRRDDASELPEVGLQAAATRLSQILLQKTARADNLESNLPAFSQMVDILCRLNREITALQKNRDDSRRALGREHNPDRIKWHNETAAMSSERFYSDPPPDSGLAKPTVPPALPPVPTSDLLARADREAAEDMEVSRNQNLMDLLRAFSGKKSPAPAAPKQLPPPDVAQQPPGRLR